MFHVVKPLNNNVVIARDPNRQEVILIGKGIGFHKKTGDEIRLENVEKLFILQDQKQQEKYQQLLHLVEEPIVLLLNDVVSYIQERIGKELDEHIHVGLLDHIAFAIKRNEQGIHFGNSFLAETKALYAREYQVAEEIVNMIRDRVNVDLHASEIAFIALHIHSAVSHRQLADVRKFSNLITDCIALIERSLEISIDRKSISYYRLVTHLRYAIERTARDEQILDNPFFIEMLKEKYPLCYTLSWKISKIVRTQLNRDFTEAEVGYLALHLQRLIS